MLLLPETLTAREARDTLRMLTTALEKEAKASAAELVVDGSPLQRFDSSALAVLLECQRQTQAWGKRFAVKHMPQQLAELAKLYGATDLLPTAA
ncbi:MAG TPA: STAS domain-containing protein [Methylibium sp.]